MSQDLVPLKFDDYLEQKDFSINLSQDFKILHILSSLKGIYMKQDFNTCQAITGCQDPDLFYCHDIEAFNGVDIPQSKPLFIFEEESKCYQRFLLPSNCRSFKMIAKANPITIIQYMHMEKDYDCVCCCCNRPEIKVFVQNKDTKDYIGRVYNPCHTIYCKKLVYLYDAKGTQKFKISAPICQLGQWCHCYGNKCQTLYFYVSNANDEIVATLIKTSAGCCKQIFANTDNFQINFPENATNRDKVLILAGALLLDYTYFDLNYFYVY